MIVVDADEWRLSRVTEFMVELNEKLNRTPDFFQTEDMQNPDYLIANKVGIERATMNDLVQKIKNRSFEGQLQRVIEKGYQPVVLVEGIMPVKTHMNMKSIYGYISSLSEKGMTVIHTISPSHTAQHLISLHDKIMKGEFQELKIPVVRSNADTKTLSKLMGIDGVDEITAKKINLKYSNVLSFTWDCYRQLKKGKSKLMDIEGVGKTKADKIAEDWVRKW